MYTMTSRLQHKCVLLCALLSFTFACHEDEQPAQDSNSQATEDGLTYSPGMCAFEVDVRPGWRRECGTVEVPQLRHATNEPEGALKTLPLYVERLTPEGDVSTTPPLVYLTGGSGFSLQVYAQIGIIPKLYASTTRPVILIEQRGNELSPGCGDANAPESCAASLAQRGVVLESLNSLESADDIADVLVALKQDQAVIWGHSYGSGLAMRVAQRHPKRVAGLILEGVSSPRGYLEPVEFSFFLEVAQRFSAWFNPQCAEDATCAELFPMGINGEADLLNFAQAPELNIPITSEFMLTGELLIEWGVSGGQGLYEGMLMFYQLLHAANAHRAGQPEIMERLLTLWGDGDRDKGAQRLIFMATTLTQQSPSFEVSHNIKGCFDVIGNWEQNPLCESLDRMMYPDELMAFSLKTDVPTLYLQGRLDSQAPLSEGDALVSQFEDLQVVTFEQCIGHMPFRDTGRCAEEVIAQWLNDPSQPPAPACLSSVCQDKPLVPSGTIWPASGL